MNESIWQYLDKRQNAAVQRTEGLQQHGLHRLHIQTKKSAQVHEWTPPPLAVRHLQICRAEVQNPQSGEDANYHCY